MSSNKRKKTRYKTKKRFTRRKRGVFMVQPKTGHPVQDLHAAGVWDANKWHIQSRWDRNATGITGNFVSLARAVFSAVKLPFVAVLALVFEKWTFSDVTHTGSDVLKGVVGVIPILGQGILYGCNRLEEANLTEEHIKNTSLEKLNKEIEINELSASTPAVKKYLSQLIREKRIRLQKNADIIKQAYTLSIEDLEKSINELIGDTVEEQDKIDIYKKAYKIQLTANPITHNDLLALAEKKVLSRAERFQIESYPFAKLDDGELDFLIAKAGSKKSNKWMQEIFKYASLELLELRSCSQQAVQNLNNRELLALYNRINPEKRVKLFQCVDEKRQIWLFNHIGKNYKIDLLQRLDVYERCTLYKMLSDQQQIGIFTGLTEDQQRGLFKILDTEQQVALIQGEIPNVLSMCNGLDIQNLVDLLRQLDEQTKYLIVKQMSVENVINVIHLLKQSEAIKIYDSFNKDDALELFDQRKCAIFVCISLLIQEEIMSSSTELLNLRLEVLKGRFADGNTSGVLLDSTGYPEEIRLIEDWLYIRKNLNVDLFNLTQENKQRLNGFIYTNVVCSNAEDIEQAFEQYQIRLDGMRLMNQCKVLNEIETMQLDIYEMISKISLKDLISDVNQFHQIGSNAIVLKALLHYKSLAQPEEARELLENLDDSTAKSVVENALGSIK